MLPPVKRNGRWLVDGGVVSVLPVDVAWMADPDVVMAVSVGAPQSKRMPELSRALSPLLSQIGRFLPNPFTARMSFDVLLRASEILLAHQTRVATAMTGPELVIEPCLGEMAFEDFGRIEEAVDTGRRAAEAQLPDLMRALESPRDRPKRSRIFYFDPVCGMVVSPSRARARTEHDGQTFYFCSPNCFDSFERSPARYAVVNAAE